jgi:hypothetical protein
MPPSFATSLTEPGPHPAGDRQLRDGADTPAPRGQVPRRWGTALVDPDPGHDHLSGARLTLGIEGAPRLPRSQAPAERQARDPKQPPSAGGQGAAG